MRWFLSFSTLLIAVSAGYAQDSRAVLPAAPFVVNEPSPYASCFEATSGTGFLTGNRSFQNFIGFISNPIQSIDPRAETIIWPMFGSAWANGNSAALPDGNMQAYGAGLTVALSDRLAVGLSQGGYAVVNLSSNRVGILNSLGLPVPDREAGGLREGWLNLGGFAQYTLIADVERQFLLTAGMRWEAPSGATQLFQGGANPAYLAPYVTVGKEFGCVHVLATGGYEFPAGEGNATTNTFYLNVHVDRKIGWLYPLVEFNGEFHTTSVNLNLAPRHDVLDLGTFDTSGNSVTMAAGANAVLVPGKLELGAVYLRPLNSNDHFEFSGVLVKMVYRY